MAEEESELDMGTDHLAERNYQMIEVLMTRLQKMEAKVEERRRACEDDQNADSAKCSSMLTSLQQDGDEADGELKAAGGESLAQSMFGARGDGGAAAASAGGAGVLLGDAAEINVTFRSSAMTDAGRRLDSKFEQEIGDIVAGAMSKRSGRKGAAAGGGASGKRRTDQRKLDEKKQERLKYERRLQSNLEHYVTRAVNELTYAVPLDDGGGSVRSAAANTLSSESNREPWPIPLQAQEMNPRLLLSYSCERISLPSGEKMFKHFVLGYLSCHLFVYTYWFVHCKFFQPDSEGEQHYLLQHVAAIYVKMLSLRSLESHKDFFFKYYPYLLANAVFCGFYYLCPGSRHLYTPAFKRILYKEVVQMLTGTTVSPSSVQVLRHQLFLDEAAEDEAAGADVADTLQMLPQTKSKAAADDDDDDDDAADAAADAAAPAAAAPSVGFAGVVSEDGELVAAPGDAAAGAAAADGAADGAAGELATKSAATSAPDESAAPWETTSFAAGESPVTIYLGGRADLRFRPKLPAGLAHAIPRQKKERFDASKVSENVPSLRRTFPL